MADATDARSAPPADTPSADTPSADKPSADTSADGPLDVSGSLPLDAHAHADGAAGVSPEPSERLLAHQVAHAHVGRLQDDARRRLDDVREQADTVRAHRRDRAETKARLEQLLSERETAAEERATAENRLEATEEAQAAQKARGSLVYAGLYTLAGTFFVAGDVIMSREIVANALKLRGDVEPWVFAIGLAMLAILLKPAYDRLVETPYWNGKKGIFAGVITICGAGALATLWILGAFRSTAFVSNARIQRLTAELMQASDPAAIGEIQAQIGTIQQGLIESPLGYWAFVVSGVLFAVAGAVCLGIGIRHARDAYHVRYRLHRARRRFAATCEDLGDRLSALDEAIAEHRVTLERQRQVLDDLPSLDGLAARRAEAEERLAVLQDQQADIRSRTLRARYQRGYAHGQTEGVSAEAFESFAASESGDGVAPPSAEASGPDAPARGSEAGDRPRNETPAPPHVTPRPTSASGPPSEKDPRESPAPHRALRNLLLRNAS